MSVLDVQIVAADERNVPCPAGWSARSVIVTGDPAAQFDRNAVIAGQRDVGGRECNRPAYRVVVVAHGGRADSVGFNLRLDHRRSEEHTSELQSLMRISYAVFCLKKKKTNH